MKRRGRGPDKKKRVRKPRFILTPAQYKAADKLYIDGQNLRFLAKKYKTSVTTMARKLREGGTKLRKRGRPFVEVIKPLTFRKVPKKSNLVIKHYK